MPAAVVSLLLAASAPCAAQTARVQIVLEGVAGESRTNVLSVLSLATAAREGELPVERIRRLHTRAPREIELALQPFGHYRPTIQSELRTDGPRWTARYRIDPGPAIRITRIELRVRGAGSEDARLRETAVRFPLKTGDVLRHALYESGKRALATQAANTGYLDATFETSQISIDLEAYTAEIVLHFDTGARFSFGPVSFNQNVLNPAVLEGFVTFRRGDPFNVTRLLEFQAALSGSPYFSRVEVQPRRDHAVGLEVPIEVDLVPRKPQRYELGIGYGTDTGPRGTVEVEQRRLNRRGHRARAETRISSIEQSIAARYMIPSRYPRTEVLSFYAGFAHLAPTSSASDKIIVGTSLGRSPGRWQETYSLAFERESFRVGPDTAVSMLLIPSVSWSRTDADELIFARRGYRLRVEIQGSHDALLSSATFFLIKTHAKVIRSLGGRTRLIGRADLGVNLTSEFRELPPTIRFFAGGDQSVRGYAYRSLGPMDDQGLMIGGRRLAVLSAELEQRFHERWGIALFFDTGDAVDSFSFSLNHGAGLGLRWLSPIGLVRADAALALSRSGTPIRFHVTIGPDL